MASLYPFLLRGLSEQNMKLIISESAAKAPKLNAFDKMRIKTAEIALKGGPDSFMSIKGRPTSIPVMEKSRAIEIAKIYKDYPEAAELVRLAHIK